MDFCCSLDFGTGLVWRCVMERRSYSLELISLFFRHTHSISTWWYICILYISSFVFKDNFLIFFLTHLNWSSFDTPTPSRHDDFIYIHKFRQFSHLFSYSQNWSAASFDTPTPSRLDDIYISSIFLFLKKIFRHIYMMIHLYILSFVFKDNFVQIYEENILEGSILFLAPQVL